MIDDVLNTSNLSEIEKTIIYYLFDPLHDINNITSTQLGKECYTSQSTVIRMYKKLGFKSYREFISVIAASKSRIIEISKIQSNYKTNNEINYSELYKVINMINDHTLFMTSNSLDENIVKRVTNRLINSNVIEIYYIGNTYSNALNLVDKLQIAGINAVLHNAMNTLYYESTKNINNKTAIIIMDYQKDLSNELINVLKFYKYYTVSIEPRSEKNSIAQDRLEYYISELDKFHYMSINYGITRVVDIISCMVGIKKLEAGI